MTPGDKVRLVQDLVAEEYPVMEIKKATDDGGHKLETKSCTEINGAGVQHEYWQECVNCHELFGEYAFITPCPHPVSILLVNGFWYWSDTGLAVDGSVMRYIEVEK